MNFLKKHDEFHIGGQCVQLVYRQVRGPLHMIAQKWETKLTAYRTSDGEYWFAREFKSLRAAREYFESLRAKYPASKTASEKIIADMGGRKSERFDYAGR